MKIVNGFIILICLHLTIFSEENIPADFSNRTLTNLSLTEVERSQLQAKNFSDRWNYETIENAALIYNQTADQWRKLGQIQKSLYCLRQAAQLNVILNRKDTAVRLLNDSLEYNGTKYAAEKSETLSMLSLLAVDKGSIEKSKKYFEEALILAGKTDSPSAQAAAFFSAGEFYFLQKKLPEALKFFERSLTFWQKSGDLKGEAKCLLEMGYVLIEQNEFSEVFEKFQQSLKNSQTINDLRGQAFAYTALGLAYNMTVHKQEALKFYAKAEQIFPENVDYFDKAVLFNGIGSIYEDYGQWDVSLSYRKKAFEFYKQSNQLFGQLATFPSLITLSFLTGDTEAALEYANEAETLAENLNAPYYLAKVRKNLGDYYLQTDSAEKSLFNFQKAFSFFAKNNFKREVALTASDLGQVYAADGQISKARNYFQQSLELNRKVKDRFAEADTLFQLAGLDFTEKNNENALKNIQSSIETTESLYSDIFNSKLKSIYFSNIFDRYELLIGVLMNMHKQSPDKNFALQALQTREKARARSLLETLSLSESDFTKDADIETIKREKEIRVLLNLKANKLTDLLSQNQDKNEIVKVSNEISELENRLEEVKILLKQNSPIYSAIKNPAPFDVGKFQKNILDENSLLLEFSFSEKESYLWLVEKNEFSSYILPPRELIESKIETLRGLLASREIEKGESIENYQNRIAKADEDYSKLAKELSDELFGQVAEKFGNKRLIIVPDGKLGYFPVSALPLPNSETGEPILLSNEVVYEPSASTLSILAANKKQINSGTKSLLIFSDPVFTSDDSRLATENKNDMSTRMDSGEKFRFVESLNSLVRLDSSKTEADSIVNIVGDSNADNLSGFSANRENLLNINAVGYKIIHFATHGFVDEKRPELSGIVLSRFDENGNKLEEFFRLHDIYGMNLNSDLVVLSACNTGIGKEVRGEGLMSLNDAFLSVGAKSVMASLWKVEDGATLELMKNFYGVMANQKLTPSKALQQAQIKLRQSSRYKSPFYWAAFTVQGDFKNVPDVARGFGLWICLVPCGLILCLGFVVGFKFIQRRNRM